MSDEDDYIKIINAPPPAPAAAGDYLPQEGEEQRPQAGWLPWRHGNVDDLAAKLENAKEKVAKLAKSLAKTVADGLELDEISVGLAITIEGDIGIASAGAEASIELTFKVKH